jgi:TolB protein
MVDGQARRVVDILKADLRRSQVFTVVDPPKSIQLARFDSTAVDRGLFTRAVENGLAVLVWGQLGQRDPDVVLDSYVVDGLLTQSNDADTVAGKRYVGSPSVLRLMVHRLADELVFRYTGEPGIARTQIAFVSDYGGGRELFVMDYDGYAPRQVTADGFLNLMPRWSPDRRYLAFTTYRGRNHHIDLVELATGKRWTLVSANGMNITPAWSPDGATLAYASSQDGNAEIYAMDTRMRSTRRLTDNPAGDFSPSWSPTGREIAFASDRGGGPQVYVMGADGSNVRRLTFEGEYNTAPTWSPRGTWIAYVCRTKEQLLKLCLISPDGQRRLQITSGPGADESPSWSPDGRHLVFSSTRDGKSHIYMMNTDGTDVERLTAGGTYHSSPSWSPV